MAAALRLLLRQQAGARSSPMMRSLFPAPYSKAAAAAAASLPAVGGVPLPPPRLREVTPRKAPPIPKGELRCCRTVPNTMTDSTKSPDKLKDLKDSKKSLQDMLKNIEEHMEMIRKDLDDRTVAHDLFSKRIDDREKLIAKIRNKRDDCQKTPNMRDVLAKLLERQDDLAKLENMSDDYDKDWAIQEAKSRFCDEQLEMVQEEIEDYFTALRRYHELENSTMEQVEQVEQVEKVKKVAKVGAAVGLVGGLLLILAKI